MLEHSDEKRFACCICTEKYGSLNELKDHMPGHTGEKPLSCDKCDYKCMNSVELNKYVCP